MPTIARVLPEHGAAPARESYPPAPGHEDRDADRLGQLLPGFGAVSAAAIICAGLLGLVLYQDQTPLSLLLRLIAAASGLLYTHARREQPVLVRAAVLCALQAAAMTANAISLAHGVRQALPLLLIWFAGAGMVEPHAGRCLRMLAPAALTVGLLGVAALPAGAAAAVLAACAFGLLLAVAAGDASRRLLEQSRQRERKLLRACRYDSLSGALTRAYLLERAAADLAVAGRYGRPLALAILDIDHFKRVNDTHGHAAGDAVIRALVSTCLGTLRATDYVGRLGGEEFVCVLPETGREDALACMERIRAGFAGLQVGSGPKRLHATVSIGVSVFTGQQDVDCLLREADSALYHAKNHGRNRVVPSGRGQFAGT